MGNRFQEYKQLDLSQINKDVLNRWEEDDTFHKSISTREGRPTFVFYEGPPSANGMPGIHHVMARAIKDIFCRYKTMKGFRVHRKAGWDTHGLPVELSVEKALNITKEDIGKKISVEEYNQSCRTEVMKYTREWEDLTRIMGYWVNMDDPYVTFDNRYIETVWWLLKKIYSKGLLYKGYSIQPYSPAAGTGLSSHELNQPGCYRDVKDTTAIAQFKTIRNGKSEFLFEGTDTDVYFLAWTTTPWTLPSNTALCVGPGIKYVKIKTFNPYTGIPVTVILAKDLFPVYFNSKNEDLSFEEYKPGDKKIPYKVLNEYSGKDLAGVQYEQLIEWVKPKGKAFEVITGDFVTIEDGTGIVHIAPTFGADDDRVAKQNGISPLIVEDSEGKTQALVDKKGRFYPTKELDSAFVEKYVNTEKYHDFAGRSVKNEYDDKLEDDAPTVDVDIAIMLKQENKAFKIEKHTHSYPHCWRTDKPVLYYPLDSWFIKTTAVKDKMVELNNTINWKPKSTGTGRFGNWLENLVDWNLSRSRFWGTPLPIWRTEDGSEEICIGSTEELMAEIKKAMAAGFMDENPYEGFEVGNNTKENYDKADLHKPYVDKIILISASGQKMFREPDLIDVWFDSGAMPFAQRHYPFESPHLLSQGGERRTPKWQTARDSSNGLLKELAKKQKENPTEAEVFLWQNLKNKNLAGYKFRQQHIIDQFIADFVCLEKQLIVEIDGGYHSLPEVKISDKQRTEILEELGFAIIRFTNEEVINNTEGVLNKITSVLNSLPFGEGRGGALFPADFIAEGVDQTRGWFFTLHAIATMIGESVAFKNIISNGLVLDSAGNKMSKRLGNAVDPFSTIEKYGSDPLRWYMITNAQPWDNLKFDISGVEEVKRKFFGTLYNTYNFFALYANVDGFTYSEEEISMEQRPEIDRWVISLLNSLLKEVGESYENYEPTRAGRAISEFVSENLSNWFVRLSRKRYWGGEYSSDKISAYQTLYTCLTTVAKLMAPIAPFYADLLFADLNKITQKETDQSVHLVDFPALNEDLIDKDLEEKMAIAQKASSMILALRRKEKLKVRQPLAKIMMPVLNPPFREQFDAIKNIVLSEVNVKEVEYLTDTAGIIKKKLKPNFKTLGPKFGKLMKLIAGEVTRFSQSDISIFEKTGTYNISIGEENIELSLEDVEIQTEDIPGWTVASEGQMTIALDINITEELKQEGIAREFVNKIQNLRKENNFEVTDRISLTILKQDKINDAVLIQKDYICTQTLAAGLQLVDNLTDDKAKEVEIDAEVNTKILVEKLKN
ncbi:MAG: isoleucine--tRNA ligase [Prolixibacteraceae bacterium]|jgi:isoleucyl-tRNA synthetase|nr:isoleucine--tRNA ligase [Prolixibacteraceae bacterium]MBT6766872.1 isoleucine--tRNA ligase [Prolixibacteraceae bacterium]